MRDRNKEKQTVRQSQGRQKKRQKGRAEGGGGAWERPGLLLFRVTER